MEGDLSEIDGHYTPRAGVLPRLINELFAKLQGVEHSVKLSMLELYNEELRDLLHNSSEPLKIFEDKSGLGVTVHGLQDTYVPDAKEGLRLLQKGSKHRTSAATKCNDKSSRSHCICTLTVQVREPSPTGGEDAIRTGKINLVDLAGSENINRSGAEQARAREAGVINQSLLALGRVINHLVDKSPHIPYRESKLTRLLKDSLGGRTRTCIIATISTEPSHSDEIANTLDYASRAKNIRNRPEANQKINRNVHIADLELMLEQYKSDLRVRERWEIEGISVVHHIYAYIYLWFIRQHGKRMASTCLKSLMKP